ncbi:MAG: epoxyqueuosine reductase QueH [Kiritimatiellae bacterium]|nr:epoxyqueuosine reductase QueH [Kiritimatiellia bacterium]
MNAPTTDTRNVTPHLATPHGEDRVLLHICCAVCAGPILEMLKQSGIETIAFFYNPNIDSPEEYAKRKEEHLRYAQKLGVRVVDADYDPKCWAEAVRGLENEPERGARCDRCFEMRLTRAAQAAQQQGIPLLATTLGISRWKDVDQVNRAGERAVRKTPSVTFWPHNWRKKGGSPRMAELAREENFYRQNYCGCSYSRLAAEQAAARRSGT